MFNKNLKIIKKYVICKNNSSSIKNSKILFSFILKYISYNNYIIFCKL